MIMTSVSKLGHDRVLKFWLLAMCYLPNCIRLILFAWECKCTSFKNQGWILLSVIRSMFRMYVASLIKVVFHTMLDTALLNCFLLFFRLDFPTSKFTHTLPLWPRPLQWVTVDNVTVNAVSFFDNEFMPWEQIVIVSNETWRLVSLCDNRVTWCLCSSFSPWPRSISCMEQYKGPEEEMPLYFKTPENLFFYIKPHLLTNFNLSIALALTCWSVFVFFLIS